MAKAKDEPVPMAADPDPAPAPLTPEQTAAALQQLQAENARLAADLNRVLGVLKPTAVDMESPEEKAHKQWLGLSAKEKTQRIVDAEYPVDPADKSLRPFKVKLVVPLSPNADTRDPEVIRKNQAGEDHEAFPLTIPAHSPEEAAGRYRKIMGIRETKGEIIAVA